MALNLDAIRAAKGKLRRETVNIPALGGDVILRELSLEEWLGCNSRYTGVGDGDTVAIYKAALAQVATALCNDDGTPMVDPAKVDETAAEFMGLPSPAVQELVAECSRMQGTVGKDDLKAAVGNSEGTPTASS